MRKTILAAILLALSPTAEAGPIRDFLAGRNSTCKNGNCGQSAPTTPISAPPAPISVPMPMPTAGGSAQAKSEIQAREGSCRHVGGSYGGGTAEGTGFSTVSADDAVRHSCFWGKRQPIEIGVARGARGWHATVFYR